MKVTLLIVLVAFCASVIAQTNGIGYATYNDYYSGFPSTSVACSDGANGIITRWGDKTISPPLYPHITSWSLVGGWNSPNCRTCLNLTSSLGYYYVSAVDACGPPPGGYNAHFDLAPEAFSSLFGSLSQGTGKVSWDIVDYRNCPGNEG